MREIFNPGWCYWLDLPVGAVFTFGGPTKYRKISTIEFREFCTVKRHARRIDEAGLDRMVKVVRMPRAPHEIEEEKPNILQQAKCDVCPNCEGSGCEDFDGETPIKCSTCNGVGHTSHVG